MKKIACDKCESVGYYLIKTSRPNTPLNYPEDYPAILSYEEPRMFICVCSKCRGKKKIDWVENIVGKKKVEPFPLVHVLVVGFNKQNKTRYKVSSYYVSDITRREVVKFGVNSSKVLFEEGVRKSNPFFKGVTNGRTGSMSEM